MTTSFFFSFSSPIQDVAIKEGKLFLGAPARGQDQVRAVRARGQEDAEEAGRDQGKLARLRGDPGATFCRLDPELPAAAGEVLPDPGALLAHYLALEGHAPG